MLKSSSRIKQREFTPLFKTGKRTNLPYFTMVFGRLLNENNQTPLQFAVVVPKTVSKKAVDRNKLKRRVYSIIRQNIKTLQNKAFYIFLMKKEAKTAIFKDLKIEVEKALQSIK